MCGVAPTDQRASLPQCEKSGLAVALVRNSGERVAGFNALWLGLALLAAGPLLYVVSRKAASAAPQA
jgi:hypothetical protein